MTAPVTIESIRLRQVNLPPKVVRTDAIQSFVTQETLLLTLRCSDGVEGTGYAYTIGTGGSSVMALLHDHLAPRLLGRNPLHVEAIWKDLFFHTHATAVGAITSLALACVDTALWDWRARCQGLPLWQLLGGAQTRVPVYTTEGGWLHLDADELVAQTLAAQAQGFRGAKIKVGRPHVSEDVARLSAVRDAVGPGFDIMVDANQGFNRPEALRRAAAFAGLDLAWLEEPMAAEDVSGHTQLRTQTAIPVAVGESMYHLSQFREYLEQGACSIVQPDVARIGGITPWIKVAHLAEGFGVPVCPHFLMELHVSLCAAVPNAAWVEYIPQLDDITTSRIRVEGGYAWPPDTPGLGIAWDWPVIAKRQLADTTLNQ
ncbi:MAG: mandelate racemase/muconate lactonizing enzyme family protein [Polaromonas sp.]|uniref:mandelate racemase/muconate lactonizing enzyme family protein n=1 Tax=Polaromonas sp. TaxID=1869339 RepID=UPI0024887BBA|nr:mandelate racemase/muconate lactonizing enzyme family protein [Polaromonas sp.]MDI1236134.1 mandelate racemase/muconate lactonizing enzyme family protein [Polaromonas sp.]